MKTRLSLAIAAAALLASPALGDGKTRQLTSTSGPAAHQKLDVTRAPVARTSQKKKAKGLTRAQVLKLVRQQVAKSARPGPAGPAGPVGPPGPAGPAGAPNNSIPVQKISFKSNQGATIQVPFDGPGMKLEAECAAQFTLRFRAEEENGLVHAFAVGAQGVTYSAGFQTQPNDVLDLVPAGEGVVSGKLEFTQFGTGTNVTINYFAAYGSAQGDCVFTGTIVQA